MTLRDRLQAVAERLRGVPKTLGMRPWSVTMRKRTWSGERAGLGVATDVDTLLSVYFGGANPRVQEVNSRDVVASGGALSAGDIKVGPLTPSCVAAVTGIAGGQPFANLDPAVGLLPAEVLFIVRGPGHPAAGTAYKRIDGNGFSLFRMTMTLRATKAIL